MEKARVNHSAWVMGAAVLRLTKLCAPKCMDYERVQIAQSERTCLDNCVKDLHNVNEATMHFFRDFEADLKAKQRDLVLELQEEVAQDKVIQKQ